MQIIKVWECLVKNKIFQEIQNKTILSSHFNEKHTRFYLKCIFKQQGYFIRLFAKRSGGIDITRSLKPGLNYQIKIHLQFKEKLITGNSLDHTMQVRD